MGKLFSIIRKLRISRAWRYKAPFLISVPYFMVWLNEIPFEIAVPGILYSFCTILGIAGFGYLSNDFTDREEDRMAGKTNVTEGLSGMIIFGMLLLLLAIAILPWVFYFPLDEVSYILLGAEFLTFIVYSFPPFRFKERGFPGAVCDALYAHAIPAALAGRTFWLMGGEQYDNFIPWTIALLSWQSLLGIRNIVLHQIGDHDKDLATGAKTFVVRISIVRANRLLSAFLLPMEILSFCIFMFLVGLEWLFFPATLLLFLVLLVFRRRFLTYQGMPQSLREKFNTLLDEYYSEWIAIVVLLILSIVEPLFIILLAAHILLFPNAIKTFFREIAGRLGILKS